MSVGEQTLFDFAFFEFHMFFRDRIIFPFDHFFGHIAAVFLGHIKISGISGAVEPNLDGGWFGHRKISNIAGPLMGLTAVSAGT